MNKVELVLQGLHNMGFQTKELKGLGYIYGYEDIPLIYIPNEDDENFIQMAIPQIFNVTDENHIEVLKIIQEINMMMKYTKLNIMNNESVWIYYEHKLFGNENLEIVLEHIIRTLHFTFNILNKKIDGEEINDEESIGDKSNKEE